MLSALLELQELDLKIETCQAREAEIPKQKEKFEIQRKRIKEEVAAREAAVQKLKIEQRECEGDIAEKQERIAKYDTQLFAVKKNDEYQALLREIDELKRKVSQAEERILTLMVEIDEETARLEEDRARVNAELEDIDNECAKIDAELAEAVKVRGALEAQRGPLADKVDAELLARYHKIRRSKKTGSAVVPLNGETCTGCYMMIPPQVVNEVLANKKIHTCKHCGRLLYIDNDSEQ